MSKDFNEFLKTIDDETLIQTSSQYFPRKDYTNNSEKQIYFSIAIAKGLLRDYHQWLNS